MGVAAQSPTGSDLMSKKTQACFCAVSFLLCSDRDFLSPVEVDTGVIRPSIYPTHLHPLLAHGNIILLQCHPRKKLAELLDISNGHKTYVSVYVHGHICMYVILYAFT